MQLSSLHNIRFSQSSFLSKMISVIKLSKSYTQLFLQQLYIFFHKTVMSPAGGGRGWIFQCTHYVHPNYMPYIIFPPPPLRDTSASGG
jgi:hypothetical protein